MKGGVNRGTKIDVPSILFMMLAPVIVLAPFWWLANNLSFLGGLILLAVVGFVVAVHCVIGLLAQFFNR